VGGSGSGMLTISGGATTFTKNAHIGSGPGSTGKVNVTDFALFLSDQIVVGADGDGSLAVADGGGVASDIGLIGAGKGSTGTVTVTGADSTWSNTLGLTVGASGNGKLTVADGATVTSDTGYLGLDSGSTGTALVTGAGSAWKNHGDVTVGVAGAGTLTIADGGAVSGRDGFIAYDTNSTGTVTVTGTGSTWTNLAAVAVGSGGNGTLIIEKGGAASNSTGVIGYDPGAVGAVMVTGAGSTWVNHHELFVGQHGTGTLSIENGASVSNTFGIIGRHAGSTGATMVTGAGSTWANADPLTVGAGGNGSLAVADRGTVSSRGGYIGDESGSNGSVLVSGAGSTWTNHSFLVVGQEGTGSLIVEDGGSVTNTVGRIGRQAGSAGAVTVAGVGSTWTNSDDLNVGVSGRGTLTIADGGIVTSKNGQIGVNPNSTGAVTVTGPGSAWTNSNEVNNGYLDVGVAGHGTLTIADGGSVTSRISHIAREDGSTGTATVTGADSTWHSGELTVGGLGGGTLLVADGGTVISGSARISNNVGSTVRSTVIVTGAGSNWRGLSDLVIGAWGHGTLIVENGGTVSSMAGVIGADRVTTGPSGENKRSVGAVTVSGAGSTWTNSRNLIVGYAGTATLSIEHGGKVTSAYGNIARLNGSVGTATVTGAGSTWTDSGDLLVGMEGDGTLNILDGGLVSVAGGAGVVEVAMWGPATGTLNIGSAAGQPPVAAGILEAAEVRFGAGTGTLSFNHTDSDYRFAPAITGTGALRVASGTTRLVTDSPDFAGTVSISGGTLVVDGNLGDAASTVGVAGSGTLGGSGTVGTTVVGAGGTVAPGNSVGTLNVAGDITFATGSRYVVEQTEAGSDRIHATGQAFLNGGSVVHVGMGATYDPTAVYTILTADGGLNGEFSGATDDFVFLDPKLGYGANDVTLTLDRNDTDFADIGKTRNQRATAGGVESLGSGNQVYDAVVVLDEPTARNAFDQLSGEIHASVKGAMLSDSRYVRDAAMARVRAAFAGVGASAPPVVAYADNSLGRPGQSAYVPPPADTGRSAVWFQGFGSWGTIDGDGNAAEFDHDTGGFFIGADGLVAETWRLGVLAGYSHSSFHLDDRASSGSSDNYHLGLYGGTQWGALGLRLGGAYTWHDVKANRSAAFPGFSDKLSADYNAATAQLFSELGYKIEQGRFVIEPYANLAYVNVHTDGFSEKGGTAALTSRSSDTDATFTTLGLRASTDIKHGSMTASVRGMLGWRHAFGSNTPQSTLAFAGGDAFTVAGVPIARDAAVLEAGVDLALSSKTTIGLFYLGQLASDAHEHGFKAELGIRF